jgi:hypothetical protein
MSHKRWEIKKNTGNLKKNNNKKLLSHTKFINVLITPFKEAINVLYIYFKDILRLKDDKNI